MITATEVSADDGLQRFRIDVVTETIGYVVHFTPGSWTYETANSAPPHGGPPFAGMGRSEALNMLLLATGTWPRLLPELFRKATSTETADAP